MKNVALAGLALIFTLISAGAFAQQVPLQAGPWAAGHVPMYSTSGGTQPIIQDAGTAGGGSTGANPSEIGITARGTGTPPYADQGHGPNGEIFCTYDAPTTNATGYHYLCMSPNADAGGLVSYGAVGSATVAPLQFMVNGTLYEFPGTGNGNVVGPATTTIGDIAIWDNTTGTLLAGISSSAILPHLADNLTSTGANQGTAFAIVQNLNAFTTVAPSTGGILPTVDPNGSTITAGYTVQVVNAGANSLTVYPPVGQAINGQSANASVSIYANSNAAFIFRGAGAWYAR